MVKLKVVANGLIKAYWLDLMNAYLKLLVGIRRIKYFLFLSVWMVMAVYLASCGRLKEKEVVPQPPPPQYVYGIQSDSFFIINDTVRINQNFSQILASLNVDNQTAYDLTEKTDGIFDLRKIRHGQPYTALCTRDSLRLLQYLIYEISTTDYLVFRLKDTLEVYKGEKEVTIVVDTASGYIKSSLWESMTASGLNPGLAAEMSDIYAWSIDFFGIQPGDYYKLIYQSLLVEGKPLGYGEILAAQFNHKEKDYFAILFTQDGKDDYFDEKGQSLKKAFLKAPLKFSRISSRFTNSRYHPVLKRYRAHHGVDYAAPSGTPVHSIGDGTVIARAWDSKGGGNYVKIKHANSYTTTYMHLKGFAQGLKTGNRVQQGQLIGYVGSTGLSTGPHLDFRVHHGGTPINPLKMISPPSDPVKPAYMAAFNKEKDKIVPVLQKIRVDTN